MRSSPSPSAPTGSAPSSRSAGRSPRRVPDASTRRPRGRSSATGAVNDGWATSGCSGTSRAGAVPGGKAGTAAHVHPGSGCASSGDTRPTAHAAGAVPLTPEGAVATLPDRFASCDGWWSKFPLCGGRCRERHGRGRLHRGGRSSRLDRRRGLGVFAVPLRLPRVDRRRSTPAPHTRSCSC